MTLSIQCPKHVYILQRLWKNSHKENGCIIWDGCTNKSKVGKGGYGLLTVDGQRRRVHRLAWSIQIGQIPKGLNVLHKCIGHRNCWNVEHLYLGTLVQNSNDTAAQFRMAHQKLTQADVDLIRRLGFRGKTHRQIAQKFDISIKHVYQIIKHYRWK